MAKAAKKVARPIPQVPPHLALPTEPVKVEPIVLTPQQNAEWEATRALMQWTCPGFLHLFYKLLSNNNGKYGAVPTRAVPYAATDAKNILINPDTFFKFPLKQRVFIIAHEVVHNVYADVELLHRCMTSRTVPLEDNSGTLPFVNELMQRAMDFRINALLVESSVGEIPQLPGDGGICYDPAIATSKDGVLSIYAKLFKKGEAEGQLFDLIMAPGGSTGGDAQDTASARNEAQWQIEVSVAHTIQQQRDQGRMPGSMQHFFNSILEPKVPWTDHIRTIFNRRVGSGSYDWRRPDRRFIVRDLHMPSKSGHGAGWVVVWGDTSGSIGSAELERYLAELSGIVGDVQPRRITVIWCDAQIHHVDEVEEASDLETIKARGVGGRGGTDIDPVFQWIADSTEAPDVFVAFTDGYFTFPQHEPSYPVIWASVSDFKYPWGEVVDIR